MGLVCLYAIMFCLGSASHRLLIHKLAVCCVCMHAHTCITASIVCTILTHSRLVSLLLWPLVERRRCVLQARGALEMPLRENKCRPLAECFGKHVGLPMPQVCTGKV